MQERFDRDCRAELVKIIVYTKHRLNSVNAHDCSITESRKHRSSVRLKG